MLHVKIPDAFKIIDVPRSGDCLFDSILEFLRKNHRIYQNVPSSSHQLTQDAAFKLYKEYICQHQLNSVRMSVELCAAGEIFNFIGNVFQENDKGGYDCISIDSDSISQFKFRNKHNIFLHFTGPIGAGHFNLLDLSGSSVRIGSNLIGNYVCLPTNRTSNIAIMHMNCASAKKRSLDV